MVVMRISVSAVYCDGFGWIWGRKSSRVWEGDMYFILCSVQNYSSNLFEP